MKTLKAFPTTNGNGFEAFKVYTFEHEINGLYKTVLSNGAERMECLDGKKSAHLWDGKNWDKAGKFVVVTDNSHRKQLVEIAAYKLKSLGFEHVYLAESKTYGFFINREGFAISFQSDFFELRFSGNYKPVERTAGRIVGTGWSDNVDLISLEGLTDRNLNGWNCVKNAPHWATHGLKVRLLGLPDMLTQSHSKYFEVAL